PEECVYDQTKLVVINEQYRELILNQRFHEYATTAGFRTHACEGYDPESKGKVEAGVKYVKQDCLYGEVFRDQEHVRQYVQDWVESVANVRIHGTTGEPPRERFERDEREHLEAYLSPACVQAVARETRRADKGKVIKNTHHYRDHAQRVSKLEAGINALIGDETGHRLCQQLKRSEPKIYKDQLVAARDLLKRHEPVDPVLITTLAERPGMTATRLQSYLEAAQAAVLRERQPEPLPEPKEALDLSAYRRVGHSSGQGVTHEPA